MSDDRFGVVMSDRSAWANAEELRALGARCVRTIVSDFDHLEAALMDHPADVRVIAALTPERPRAGGGPADLAGWDAMVEQFARRFAGRVWALECLSQWDVRGIAAGTAVACARSAARILRESGSGIVPLLGSVAGRSWMASLRAACRLLSGADRELLGGACFHPYAKNARGFPGFDFSGVDHSEIDIAVQNANDIAEMPIWATEFGVTVGHAGGEAGQARYVRDAVGLLRALPAGVLAAATYYCWWDPIGVPQERGEHAYGLRREDLLDPARDTAPRPAWYAFAEAAGGTGTPPARFAPRPYAMLA
jgi:hypothetical protein